MEPTQHRTAGGIVIGDSGTIALVFSKNSQAWLFPKGKIEAGENDEDAARREIAEETGITDLDYLDDLGHFERVSRTRDGLVTDIKDIHLYLYAALPGAELVPTREIEGAQWVPFARVLSVLGAGERQSWFEADRAFFTKVFDRVRGAIQRD